MFKKHGITVLQLKRVAMGNLKLDENLDFGQCRYLNQTEVEKIKQN
jgi:16S rRNA U516 pseudouridylate synthase RsuA-like enzyme